MGATFAKMDSLLWKWPASNAIPKELKNLTNVWKVFKSYGMRAGVEYFNYSIGYVPYSGKSFLIIF